MPSPTTEPFPDAALDTTQDSALGTCTARSGYDASSPDDDITVFYDGACALCRREIGFVRSLEGLDSATFTDISALPAEKNVAPGVKAATAMARMHVRLADGTIVQGAAAFAAMWGASRRFRFLSRLAGSRIAIVVLDKVYDVVLIFRPPLSRAVGRFDAWRERCRRR